MFEGIHWICSFKNLFPMQRKSCWMWNLAYPPDITLTRKMGLLQGLLADWVKCVQFPFPEKPLIGYRICESTSAPPPPPPSPTERVDYALRPHPHPIADSDSSLAPCRHFIIIIIYFICHNDKRSIDNYNNFDRARNFLKTTRLIAKPCGGHLNC